MLELAENDILLAIESAIAGGSICLWSQGKEIDGWAGDGGVSRAEDLLPNIAEMLKRNAIDRKEIGGIAVSIGPGSFTGIRIGIATALGLKNALSIPCIGVAALEAIALSSTTRHRVIVAIPMGRNGICFQGFDLSGDAQPVSEVGPFVSRSEPAEALSGFDFDEMIAHQAIYELMKSGMPNSIINNAGSNISALIARAAAIPMMHRALDPIFLSLAAQ